MFFKKKGGKRLDAVKAVVQKLIREGKHGPFAVATSDQIGGSVTFSLEPTVWQEDEWPEEGMMVFLGKLREKRAGWRAKTGRFWKPSDEQQQQPERSRPMQFLYPTSRQFPFDEACERIVRELELRNWNVPGMTVEFDNYGSGDQKMTLVRKVKGNDFQIRFGRRQGRMPGGRFNDTAAACEINIPQRELHVYHDESGPTFYLYVGNDWEKDRDAFVNGWKVNSKLNGRARIYLQYSGTCLCRAGGDSWCSGRPHTHPGRRPPLLAHTNDLGREYDPEGKEPKLFKTAEVMDDFRKYLVEVVLPAIVSYSIPTEKVDVLTPPALIPFPDSIGQIFCFGDDGDVNRIKQGRANSSQLLAADRYGLAGSGYRLVPLGVRDDGTVPETAYDGFLWCGIGEVTADMAIEKLEVPGHYRWSDREKFVLRVKPSSANSIYIADHAAYEKRRKEIGDTMGNRDQFTDEEVADFIRARARTLVPISEYKGGFEQPVVLVNRELSFDEVEVVSGPHNERYR